MEMQQRTEQEVAPVVDAIKLPHSEGMEVETRAGASAIQQVANVPAIRAASKSTTRRSLSQTAKKQIRRIRYRIFSNVWSTRYFRKRFSYQIRLETANMMYKFEHLSVNVMINERKEKLSPNLLNYFRQFAYTSVWFSYVLGISTVLLMLFMITMLSCVYSYMSRGMFHGAYWVAFPLVFLGFFFHALIFLFINMVSLSRGGGLSTSLTLAGVLFLIELSLLRTVTYIHSYSHLKIFADSLSLIVQTLMASTAIFLVTIIYLSMIVYCFLRWRIKRLPSSIIALRLLDVLHRLDKHPERWLSIRLRHSILADIEVVAYCFETCLLRRLPCPNPETAAWQKRAFDEIAKRLRLVQRWILTPKADTRDQVIRYLSDFLDCFLRGDWDTLAGDWGSTENKTPESFVVPIHWTTRILSVCHTLTIAGLPLLGAAIFHWMRPKIEFPPTAIAVMVAWPMLIVLATLDPDFKTKVAMFKDAASLLPGGKDKK